jgi:hypothetical protein
MDQAAKVIEFVERWTTGYESLAKIPEEKRDGVEKLMLDTINAVRDDFSEDRQTLTQFEKNVSGFRKAALLYLPSGTIIWFPYFIFHTLQVFIVYLLVVRVVQAVRGEAGWGIDDTAVLLVAVLCAAVARLAVTLIPVQKKTGMR